MMDAVLDPAVEEVTFMLASRLGKSTVLENILGYYIDYDPAPMMMVLPDDTLAKRFSKIQLAPMIRHNPHIREKFGDMKQKSEGNEISFKAFRGGHIIMSSAQSPSSLSMYSVRIVLFDEVDRMVSSSGTEGDPIELGKQRAANYLNRKYIYASSPLIEETSKIDTLFGESDQRFLKVPCPHCEYRQILVFGPRSRYSTLTSGFLKFEKQDSQVINASYVCANCKREISEGYKEAMIKEGIWTKTRPEVKRHAGFQLSGLYSSWTTWTEIAQAFVRSERNYNRMKTFVNTKLGETFSMRVNYRFETDKFLSRREGYTKIPRQVVYMNIGVDMQDNRLVGVCWGFGADDESWFIDRYVAMGSPGDETTWDLMAAYIFKTRYYENGYPAEYGKLGGVYAVGVDSRGHYTKNAYEFVAKYSRMRIFAVIGLGGFGKPFVKPGLKKRKKIPAFNIGVDAGKELIYHRLEIQIQKDENGKMLPTPGAMHFNMSCDKDFFDQLTAEVPVIKGEGPNKSIVWENPGNKANEMLDCTNYALAAQALLDIKDIKPLAETLRVRMEVFEKEEAKKKEKEQGGGTPGEGTAPAAPDAPTPSAPTPPAPIAPAADAPEENNTIMQIEY